MHAACIALTQLFSYISADELAASSAGSDWPSSILHSLESRIDRLCACRRDDHKAVVASAGGRGGSVHVERVMKCPACMGAHDEECLVQPLTVYTFIFRGLGHKGHARKRACTHMQHDIKCSLLLRPHACLPVHAAAQPWHLAAPTTGSERVACS